MFVSRLNFFIVRFFVKLFAMENKKGIFFFLPVYSMGGGERVHCDILHSVKECRTYTHFLYPSKNSHFKNEFQELSKCVDLSQGFRFRWIRDIRMGIILSKIPYGSIVFISGVPEMYQWCSIAKHLCFIDLIHWGAGYHFEQSFKCIQYLRHRIVVTKTLKFQLARLYMKHGLGPFITRIQFIPNSVDISIKSVKKEDMRFKALYVGRNDPVKRIHYIGRIAKRTKNLIEISVCGCKKEDFTSDHQKHLNILGILPKKKLEEYYQQSHAILITSILEGFPLVLMEAMAYGVIPISTNVGGIPDHIIHEENGFLIDSRNSQEIVDKFVEILKKLAVNKIMRQRISESAHSYAIQHFSKENFTLSYRKLLCNGQVKTDTKN